MIFILQLSSNDSTFEYSFPHEFLCKNFKTGVIKLDDYVEFKTKKVFHSVNKNNN